jgi:hypothetical protein
MVNVAGSLFAHKNLLALVSPVFRKMFYGNVKEEVRGNTQ